VITQPRLASLQKTIRNAGDLLRSAHNPQVAVQIPDRMYDRHIEGGSR
jgi:hypothetical protein